MADGGGASQQQAVARERGVTMDTSKAGAACSTHQVKAGVRVGAGRLRHAALLVVGELLQPVQRAGAVRWRVSCAKAGERRRARCCSSCCSRCPSGRLDQSQHFYRSILCGWALQLSHTDGQRETSQQVARISYRWEWPIHGRLLDLSDIEYVERSLQHCLKDANATCTLDVQAEFVRIASPAVTLSVHCWIPRC